MFVWDFSYVGQSKISSVTYCCNTKKNVFFLRCWDTGCPIKIKNNFDNILKIKTSIYFFKYATEFYLKSQNTFLFKVLFLIHKSVDFEKHPVSSKPI